MNIHILLIILGLVSLTFNSYADNSNTKVQKYTQCNKEKEEKQVRKKLKKNNSSFQKLSYLPPCLGSPSTSRLIGMALRGSETNFVLSVLTPAHTGISIKAQPDIFWYTSQPISKPFQFVEFVLNSDEAIKPVLRTHLTPVTKAGIQKISLADYNVSLQPGIEYTWVISLVPDPAARSHDFVTSGKIRHVIPSNDLLKSIRTTSVSYTPYRLAELGFWYDALAKLIEQTKENPQALVMLLKQVELDLVANNIKEGKPS